MPVSSKCWSVFVEIRFCSLILRFKPLCFGSLKKFKSKWPLRFHFIFTSSSLWGRGHQVLYFCFTEIEHSFRSLPLFLFPTFPSLPFAFRGQSHASYFSTFEFTEIVKASKWLSSIFDFKLTSVVLSWGNLHFWHRLKTKIIFHSILPWPLSARHLPSSAFQPFYNHSVQIRESKFFHLKNQFLCLYLLPN